MVVCPCVHDDAPSFRLLVRAQKQSVRKLEVAVLGYFLVVAVKTRKKGKKGKKAIAGYEHAGQTCSCAIERVLLWVAQAQAI